MPGTPSGQSKNLPKLTVRQRQWVNWFLGGGDGSCKWNATGAARQAGYRHPNVDGPNNLVNASIAPHIADALEAAGLTRDIALALVADDAMRSDAEILEVAKQAPGIPAAAAAVSALVSARTTARTNLLKVHGAITDRVNVKHSGRVDHVHRTAKYDNLNDDELESLERLAAKVASGEAES